MAPTLRRTSRTGRGYIEPKLEIINALPFQMVLIPDGIFTMGSSEDENGRSKSESPLRDVPMPKFFMSCYPITQAQWRQVAVLEPIECSLETDPSNFKGDNRPVEKISWYEAVEFCQRLECLTNRPYRLPSEAEWEYACRAGTLTPFYFGETITGEVANYGSEETTPVDHFGIANKFGPSDMHGNVYEWCQDHWHGNCNGAPTDGSAWVTDNEKASRVIRGGSWFLNPGGCRSASRAYNSPENRGDDIGFRVVCSVPRAFQ